MVTVRLDDQGFTTRLSALSSRLARPAALTNILGRAARNRFVSHFNTKNREEPNRLGGSRTNFWRQVANSVTAPAVSGDGATVTFSVTQDGFAQRLFGGEIHAKRGLYLTIPMVPEAHGRTAATFERETGLDLFFIGANFGGMLAYKLPGGSDFNIRVAYLLKPSVTQKPDPTAMPDIGELQDELVEVAQKAVDQMIQGGNSQA
jgi:hypothetical protein